jgi:hypothetical protein
MNKEATIHVAPPSLPPSLPLEIEMEIFFETTATKASNINLE